MFGIGAIYNIGMKNDIWKIYIYIAVQKFIYYILNL